MNIWTQDITPADKKPIMVWIHGGGLASGSSTELIFYRWRRAECCSDKGPEVAELFTLMNGGQSIEDAKNMFE